VKTGRRAKDAGFLALFAALSLAAVGVGCAVARANGAPAGVWGRDLAAWAVGGLLAAAVGRWAGRRTLAGLLIAAPLGLAGTLLAAGQQGVHRWVDLGPVHMNVAEVLLPAAVVALAAMSDTRWAGLAGAVALGFLIAQPDASQATALGGAILAVVALRPLRGLWRMGAIVLVGVAVAAAWGRRDPLAPVADVEGIMGLASALSPLVAMLAWVALAGAVLAPLVISRVDARPVRMAAFALALYGVGSATAPLLGAFPVPLVGMGVSPILGFWLGAGLLAALARLGRRPAAP
jgi:cell division protein FtsW (lipid II flippase)